LLLKRSRAKRSKRPCETKIAFPFFRGQERDFETARAHNGGGLSLRKIGYNLYSTKGQGGKQNVYIPKSSQICVVLFQKEC